MTIIDGKQTAQKIRQELTEQVQQLKAEGKKVPHLAAVLVGNDTASETYVRNKVKDCEQVGFDSTLVRLDESISEEELLREVHKLNDNPDVDGFIVQLPLPKHINDEKITFAIKAEKDVDGFHPINVGRMAKGLPS
ncbi:MAG: tetrahydrofolate dehydrogenase/cyclohydrolase catalytic domain-containing protein, partial [Bacteroidota bacterium]